MVKLSVMLVLVVFATYGMGRMGVIGGFAQSRAANIAEAAAYQKTHALNHLNGVQVASAARFTDRVVALDAAVEAPTPRAAVSGGALLATR